MTKKTAILFTTLALLLAPTSLPADASAKTYSNCFSLNKVYSGGVAQKAGYKNVGGTLAKKPKVSSALYLANKKLDKDKDGIVCEVLKKVVASPTPPPTAAPEPPLTIDNLDPRRVGIVSQREIIAGIENSPAVSESVLIIQAGPSLNPSDYSKNKQSVIATVRLFSDMTVPQSVYINWFTNKDADWIDSAINNSGGSTNSTPNRILWSEWVNNSGKDCNMANGGEGSKGAIITQCLLGTAPADHYLQTSAHEYFHFVQSAVTTYEVPLWFFEGAPSFVGLHVGGYVYGDYKTARSNVLTRWSKFGIDHALWDAISRGDQSFIVSRFKELESKMVSPSIQTSGNALGMLFTEALVASYGLKTWKEFLTKVKPLGFSKAFEDVYKLTLQEAYVKVSPYVASQLIL